MFVLTDMTRMRFIWMRVLSSELTRGSGKELKNEVYDNDSSTSPGFSEEPKQPNIWDEYSFTKTNQQRSRVSKMLNRACNDEWEDTLSNQLQGCRDIVLNFSYQKCTPKNRITQITQKFTKIVQTKEKTMDTDHLPQLSGEDVGQQQPPSLLTILTSHSRQKPGIWGERVRTWKSIFGRFHDRLLQLTLESCCNL